jgi:5-formyltetrahydrofolate cyclo-ligase
MTTDSSDLATHSKLLLRQKVRRQRQALSPAELTQSADLLLKQYIQHLDHRDHKHIALYIEHDNEIGTKPLLRHLQQQNCKIYLPKISKSTDNNMQFCLFNQQSSLTNNRYGIPEPDIDQVMNVNNLDLILMPLTAFDHRGNRIGMGGGYYDRALSKLTNHQTKVVGLAYDFQEIDHCPIESFDQPIKMIITPTRMIDFRA